MIASAEEDSDGDGKFDKWEIYDGTRLASVAFDTQHRGTPDRRLVYGANGTARLEVDMKGDGQFVTTETTTRKPQPAPRNPQSTIRNPQSAIRNPQ